MDKHFILLQLCLSLNWICKHQNTAENYVSLKVNFPQYLELNYKTTTSPKEERLGTS